MKIHNSLFDPVVINEPVLQDLLASVPVQRLRGVLQHGISGLIDLTPPITRFDHSVGAMLIVRHMGGSLREQIAALLHDVSHTAFSHVMDHVFDSAASQSFHEEIKEPYLAGTELPELLNRHGFNWRDFLNEDGYPLLEQPAPRICADRLDYFLRDAVCFELASPGDVKQVFDHLVVADDRLALNDLYTARWLADTFMWADNHSWSNYNEVGLYECTAAALRYAFEHDILEQDDIWGTDAAVWKKMNASADPVFQTLLEPIRPDVQFVEDKDNPDFVLATKIRTLDPDVVVDGKIQPLSEWQPDFGENRRAYVRRKSGIWHMRRVRE